MAQKSDLDIASEIVAKFQTLSDHDARRSTLSMLQSIDRRLSQARNTPSNSRTSRNSPSGPDASA